MKEITHPKAVTSENGEQFTGEGRKLDPPVNYTLSAKTMPPSQMKGKESAAEHNFTCSNVPLLFASQLRICLKVSVFIPVGKALMQ